MTLAVGQFTPEAPSSRVVSTAPARAQHKTAQHHLLGAGPANILHAAEVVARSNGYDVEELIDSHAAQPLRLRQALYWACHELLGCSYPLIGQALGKDHTTVLAGARRFAALVATEPALAEVAQRIAEVAAERPGRPGPEPLAVMVVAGLQADQLAEARRWLADHAPAAKVLVAGEGA